MKKPLSILIVEDERLVARDLQQTLIELGYDAFAIASSAEEAVQRASERCPEIVLMDIRIKGRRDGIEAAELLTRQFGVTLVYLTAHSDEATLERAKKTEPHGYLLKPVRPAELKSTIEVSHYRHQMERRLRESEQRHDATLRSISDAVITVDLDSKITFMNRVAETLTGLACEEALGRPSSEVLRLLGASQEPPLARALRENRAVELPEASLQNLSTGAKHLISDSAAPVVSEGQTLGAVMVFRDVTEQRRLQKRLEFSDRLDSLGTMAAGVAHEVNNPLAAALGNVDFALSELSMLRAELGAGAVAEAAQRLDELSLALSDARLAAQRIGRIVSDLRAFSRSSEAGEGLVEVNPCLEAVLRTTEREILERARLTTRLGATPLVKLEEPRLAQVLANLLRNAAQAISPGEAAQNEVTATTYTDPEGRAVLEVKDTGAGIPPALLPRIFEPFFTTKGIGGGTGLGLSICHGLVASFGGEITVSSAEGAGSTFRVLLPAAPEARAVAASADNPGRGRLLVIDDDEMLLSVFARIFREHELVAVESAEAALVLLRQGARFDVILSDLMMPTMTGRDFYETLLSEDPDLAQRIVFLTGGARSAALEAFLRSIPNRLIEKPFSVEGLRAIVRELLCARS